MFMCEFHLATEKQNNNQMKLQLALDDLTIEQSIGLLNKVANYVDIIEIGTPFIMMEGMKATREIKMRFPQQKKFYGFSF